MPILEKDIFDAVSAWGDGLLEISNAYENSGIEKATLVAEGMLDELYLSLIHISEPTRPY